MPTVGTTVLLGNTNVTLTATDECGNTESCSFSVDVKFSNGVEEFTVNDIKLYPSPNNGVFSIELGALKQKVTKLRVVNVVGKVVFENTNLDGNSMQKLDLPNIANGIYFVEIKTDNQTFVKRFMKQ